MAAARRVLMKFYKDLEYARLLILLNSGLIGVAIGFMAVAVQAVGARPPG